MFTYICLGIVGGMGLGILAKGIIDKTKSSNGTEVTCHAISSEPVSEDINLLPGRSGKKGKVSFKTVYEAEINGKTVRFTDSETTPFPIANDVEKDFIYGDDEKFYNLKIVKKRISSGLFFIILSILSAVLMAIR